MVKISSVLGDAVGHVRQDQTNIGPGNMPCTQTLEDVVKKYDVLCLLALDLARKMQILLFHSTKPLDALWMFCISMLSNWGFSYPEQ